MGERGAEAILPLSRGADGRLGVRSSGSEAARPLSVVVQVFWFKRFGKRIFKMAPIHHHFEHIGWSEPTVVIRFWIISFVLALAGLSTLKLR